MEPQGLRVEAISICDAIALPSTPSSSTALGSPYLVLSPLYAVENCAE